MSTPQPQRLTTAELEAAMPEIYRWAEDAYQATQLAPPGQACTIPVEHLAAIYSSISALAQTVILISESKEALASHPIFGAFLKGM